MDNKPSPIRLLTVEREVMQTHCLKFTCAVISLLSTLSFKAPTCHFFVINRSKEHTKDIILDRGSFLKDSFIS